MSTKFELVKVYGTQLKAVYELGVRKNKEIAK